MEIPKYALAYTLLISCYILHYYKVETIGDAYMVVCGVPEPMSDHAERVADFALEAVLAAKEVKSPVTGKPLQVSDLSNI